MSVARAAHTATLLSDGRVLLAGGFRPEGRREVAIASAEIFDPVTNTFTPTGSMNEARSSHTATLLPDGQVLIIGGWGVSERSSTAELYDPQTGTFSYTTSLGEPWAGMTSTLLNDGTVLIAGGESARGSLRLTAEIYDPVTKTFTPTGDLVQGRSIHTATLLKDGKVLLVGGSGKDGSILASAEIYNPDSRSFSLVGELNAVRYKHAAVLLVDGDVLVVGGSNEDDWGGKYTSTEIFDPNTGEFSQGAELSGERFKHPDAVVLLKNGDVLVGGGNRQIEIYDAMNRRFLSAEQLDRNYYASTVTLLQDGRALISGGYDDNIQLSDKAWIYNAPTG